MDRLFEIWLGFLIKHQGQWTATDEKGLRAWAEFGHQVTDQDFAVARDRALVVWRDSARRVILCAGAMCTPKRPRPTAQELVGLEGRWGCPVLMSDCQNRCRQAPSTTVLEQSERTA